MAKSVSEIASSVRAGDAKAIDTVATALSQLKAVQPELLALGDVSESSALAAAERVDERVARGEDLPLAGVAFTAKGNICTTAGTTTAGSRILAGHESPYAATAVARLESAGAVCVGKTNLDEFGMGSSTENSAYEVVRNPWRTECVPGGSSGGAAALAAATRGMIHLGSDTGGSIRQPASYCGVTGFKPTYGRVSRYGLLAFGSSLDQIGCLQATASECARVLSVIGGHDPMDSTTSARALATEPLSSLKESVDGLRVGVAPDLFPPGIDAGVEEHVRAGVEHLRGLGAEVVEVEIPHAEYANPVYVLISAAEASSNLARYDGVHYGHRASDADDLLDLYARSRSEGFGAEVQRRIMIGTFVLSAGYYDAFYNKACRVRTLLRRDFEAAFERVDVIACPTSPVPAFALGERLSDPLALYAVDVLTVPANLAGIPGVSIPCGFTPEGLPIGLQLLGRQFEDDVVLSVAHTYQQSTDWHERPPPVNAWS